ncbi:MAG: hypothetical protein V4675_02400 [Verrucomicrobiota bacterium]
MKRRLFCLFASALALAVPSTLAHGRSEQMTRELNAAAPEWLSIGVPIRAEPATSLPSDQIVFRSRSGGATNSRNRVQIPSRGIEIKLDYEADWTGNNEAGSGVSLSPNGRRLLVNSGPTSRMYEIQTNGSYGEVPLQLPHVTYGAGLKGYLRKWSWVDNEILIARAEITDEAGHEIVENRIYVYHMHERALTRLDLSALNLPSTDGLEFTKVASDLNHLKIIVGDSEFTVKADLKTPPEIEKHQADVPKTTPPPATPKRSAPNATIPTLGEESTLPLPWSIIAVSIAAALALLWLLLKRRS